MMRRFMSEPTTSYLLMTCQVGAEAALKDELAHRVPPLRPSYGRPGFVTFKLDAPRSVDAAQLDALPVFARVVAASLGQVRDAAASPEALAARAAELVGAAGLSALVLHAWSLPLSARGQTEADEQDTASMGPILEALERGLAGVGVATTTGREPRLDELVLDVVAVKPGEWWLGVHRHARGCGPLAGGNFAFEPLEGAPSRAWQKIEEAIACFELPLRPGASVVEIGSAPGGIVLALLRRGMHVVGIDAAAMSPEVQRYARSHAGRSSFRHLTTSASRVTARDLPRGVDWIVSDINAAPPVTLAAVDHIAGLCPQRPRGIIATLKLGEPGLEARIPGYLQRMKRAGYAHVACRQLPANRREVTLAAWR